MYKINLLPGTEEERKQKLEQEKSPFQKQLDSWEQTYEECPVDEILDKIVEAVFNEIIERNGDSAVYEDIGDMLCSVDWEREFWERLAVRMHQQIVLEKQGPWDVAARAIDKACIALRNAQMDISQFRACAGGELSSKRSGVRSAISGVLDFLGFGR